MVLTKKEQTEWVSIRAKSKRHNVPVKRVQSNIHFGDGVYTQLGTGNGTRIIDAKIKVNKALKSDSFEFKELNRKSQLKAIKDYISGWQETHNEVMTEDEVRNVLIYSDGVYDINGNYIGD